MNNLTRSRYTELLELLEISQLMDTTVRNGYYDEALELIEFARKLGKVTKLSSTSTQESAYIKTGPIYKERRLLLGILLPQAELGPNDHWEGAPHFIIFTVD